METGISQKTCVKFCLERLPMCCSLRETNNRKVVITPACLSCFATLSSSGNDMLIRSLCNHMAMHSKPLKRHCFLFSQKFRKTIKRLMVLMLIRDLTRVILFLNLSRNRTHKIPAGMHYLEADALEVWEAASLQEHGFHCYCCLHADA